MREATYVFVVLVVIVCFLTLIGADESTAHNYNYRKHVIMKVFGPKYGPSAVRVAECESGLNPHARNGQYVGLFQVSPGLRRDYRGYGQGAWRQAKHARRVFNASGKDWNRHWSSCYN